MKKKLALILAIVMMVTMFAGCGSSDDSEPVNKALVKDDDTWTIRDSCEREIEMTGNIDRVAPTGASAEMVLMTIAPEKMVGLSNKPSKEQAKYYPEEVRDLPVFGQMYGKNANLNIEALLAEDPQLIIDVGEKTDSTAEEMDALQEQLGVPVMFIDGSIDKMADCYHALGIILAETERTDKQVAYIDEAIKHAKKRAKDMEDNERMTVYYGTGPDGLAANAAGSIQADVIELIGAKNAIEVPENELTGKNGGTIVSLEKVYKEDPDMIIVSDHAAYESLEGKEWKDLAAVKANMYYEVPVLPFCWMGGPPSVNRILGIWWLGNLCYPQNYNFDMKEKTIEFYDLFYGYEMSEEEAEAMLQNSSLKW